MHRVCALTTVGPELASVPRITQHYRPKSQLVDLRADGTHGHLTTEISPQWIGMIVLFALETPISMPP